MFVSIVSRWQSTRVSLGNLTRVVGKLNVSRSPIFHAANIRQSHCGLRIFEQLFFRLFVGLGLAEALSRYSVTVVTVENKVDKSQKEILYYIYNINCKLGCE